MHAYIKEAVDWVALKQRKLASIGKLLLQKKLLAGVNPTTSEFTATTPAL
jgi:hypothetical protein